MPPRAEPLRSFALLLGLCLAGAAAPAAAQQRDAAALERELDALKAANQALEQRLRALEAAIKAPPAPSAPPAAVAPAAQAPAPRPAPAQDAATPAPARPLAPPPASSASAAAVVDAIVPLREAWRQVARDLPESRVVELLGKPSRELRINGKRVWYYVYPGIGPASVFWTEDRVSSFQPPNLGFTW